MPDPNATYKQAFADLTVKLGRIPTCKDKEWVAIGEELRKAWLNCPADESRSTATNVDSNNGVNATPDSTSAKNAEHSFNAISAAKNGPMTTNANPQPTSAVGIDARESVSEPLINPGTGAKGDPDRTTGKGENGAPGIDDGAMVPRKPRVYAGRAGRGPNGGVIAVCVQCGEEWERAVSRGRPAYRCGECRS